MGVTRPDERPPEQLEGRLVAVEEPGPVVVVDLVHVDGDQSEAGVDYQEDEEEDKDVGASTTASDSKDEGDNDDNGDRYKVHNEEGRKRFRHLENFNMNELCARVVIKATKPV